MEINSKIKEKSEYCLNCKLKPCSNNGCPLNNYIPTFIKNIKEGNLEEAYRILSKTTVFPAICGRICPHERQCQGSCIRGIKGNPVSIGELEAFVGDYGLKNNLEIEKFNSEKYFSNINKEINIKYDKKEIYEKNENIEKSEILKKDKRLSENINIAKRLKVAIVGGGPSGLTAAAFLARNNVDVTIFERYNYLGGLLVYGIPEFRLSREIIQSSINKILNLNVKVEYNKELGKNLFLEELLKEFDYIYLSIGANKSTKMNIEGENLQGVYGGNELLEYGYHPDYVGKSVIVNGGGNVAMDTARTINRLGAKEVTIVYRRAREQMPAENKEIEDAISEGIKFLFQHNIVKINGEEKASGIEVIKTELVQKEGEKRLSPVNIEGSNYNINADYIVMALGSRTEGYVKNLGLELDKKGYIKVDEDGKTSNNKIFAGGDVSSNGKGTVAWAARQGRDVAEKILINYCNFQ